jgi:hypothetical protein
VNVSYSKSPHLWKLNLAHTALDTLYFSVKIQTKITAHLVMLYVCKCVNKTNAKQIFISLWAHIEKDYALAQINSTGVSTLSS